MLNSIIGGEMSIVSFLLCIFTAMVLGLLSALVFTARDRHSAAFRQSLALLPPVVALVIMLVNGNIGAGLAVAGTFALVRFRSAPGSAKEITALFFTVAIGIACGMGYIGYAALFFLVMAVYALALSRFRFGEETGLRRMLKITIPENVDYDELFDDLFEKYTRWHELEKVRTTNMGTLYELSYAIELKDPDNSKEFIDAIRCRNGNLNLSCGRDEDRELM